MKKINYIDLFCGCGGLSEGFENTGLFELKAAIDWDKPCVNTFKNRCSTKWGIDSVDDKVFEHDLQDIKGIFESNVLGIKTSLNNDVKVIIGGPPCQAYSVAGRIRDKNGMHDDYRNYLFESYIEFVKFYKPDLFVFENVPGILSARPGGVKITERITEGFKNIGYFISNDLAKEALFNVMDFGVAQDRKRVIIIGVNQKKYGLDTIQKFYEELKKKKQKKKYSVGEAIGDLPSLYPIIENNNKRLSHRQIDGDSISWHTPRFHSQRDIKIFEMLAQDIRTDRKYSSVESLKELYTKVTGKISNVHKYHVLEENLPSNTIVAHLYKDGLRHIHYDPKQARSITVRESARLQSFPDDFQFLGSMGDAYKMIGNAVPPKFSEVIAQTVYKILLSENESNLHP